MLSFKLTLPKSIVKGIENQIDRVASPESVSFHLNDNFKTISVNSVRKCTLWPVFGLP